MNSHKNARLTVYGRALLIERIHTLGVQEAAAQSGISVHSAYNKWKARFQREGLTGLADRTSRPTNCVLY